MGILSAPVNGLLRVFEEIAQRAESEIYDDEAVKAELTALYSKFEAGAISEKDFEEQEMALALRLEEIEQRRAASRKKAPPRRRRRVIH